MKYLSPGRARWLIGLGLVTSAALAGPSLAGSLLAQTPPVVSAGADGITATEIARHLRVLLADTMRWRDTPSSELERTAQYLVRQFRYLGFQPESMRGRRDSTWLQHYPVPGQQWLNLERSRVVFYQEALRSGGIPVLTEAGELRTLRIDTDFAQTAYFVPELRPPAVVASLSFGFFSALSMGSDNVALIAGRQTPASLAENDLRTKVAIYIPPSGLDAASQQRVLEQLYRTTRGVVFIGDAETPDGATRFAAALDAARQQPMPVAESFMRDPLGADHWPWAVAVWPPALRGLAAVGVDVAQVRADTTPRVQDLPYLRVFLSPDADVRASSTQQTAPNVMAWLEGSDSVLRKEVLVVTTRMDGSGRPAVPESHSGNQQTEGVGDNAAGVAALLSLAQAWSRPEARPRRSVLLLAVSGGAKDLWGSRFFLEDRRPQGLVANLTLEMSGRPADDSVTTVVVEGAEDIDRLASPATWAAATQPELGVRVIAGPPTTRRPAIHVPFMQWGVPSLYLHTPTADRGLDGGPAVDDATAAHAARLTRLVFAVGQAIANADQRPQWKQGAQTRRLTPEP